MTNQEAIRILTDCIERGAPSARCTVAELEQAFRAGVKALSSTAAPTYDPTKVRELLDALAECRPVYNVGDYDAVVEQNQRLLAAQGCAYYVQQSAVRALRDGEGE